MSLWKIAWRSIQQRGVASTLTTFSMALGVMLVVVVLTIHGVVSESFKENSSLGYNMIVGAKGGSLQLTLNTVYYLSEPVENVPYEFYLEFLPADERRAELQHSIAYHVHQSQWQTAGLPMDSVALHGGGPLAGLAAQIAHDTFRRTDEDQLIHREDGRFAPFVDLVIPLCLGDYFGSYRVVGTTTAMFDDLVFDLDENRKYEFSSGRNFKHYDDEHGFFEAVVGATVAREMNVKIGDVIAPAHGEPGGHTHQQTFTVVGVLAPSGKPNDRAVFVNMEGFYLMADHAKPVERGTDESENADSAHVVQDELPGDQPIHDQGVHGIDKLPVEQREVTSLLVRTKSPLLAPGLENLIEEGALESSLTWSPFRPLRRQKSAQAALPIAEIYKLFLVMVRPIQMTLLLLTAMICVVSGISILVSIYNSMSERKHEIAVMRALGAGRVTVMSVILLESIFLALGGGVFGWFAGHLFNALASSSVESWTGVSIGLFDFAPSINALGMEIPYPEWILIPALIVLAVIVGFLPAMAAYRTDVARSLGK